MDGKGGWKLHGLQEILHAYKMELALLKQTEGEGGDHFVPPEDIEEAYEMPILGANGVHPRDARMSAQLRDEERVRDAMIRSWEGRGRAIRNA